MATLRQAATPEEMDSVRGLLLEYAEWLDVDLCFQGFREELAALPGKYVPPDGRLLLADDAGGIAGCIGLRRFSVDAGEVKRLYIRPAHRGRGIGRLLAGAVIAEARAIGYRRLLLDTLPARMPDAARLYASLGFKPAAPYYENPIAGAAFMELVLQ